MNTVAVKERRKYYRHPFEIPIRVTQRIDQKLTKHRTEDVSEGGICFLAERLLEKGSEIEVAIPVLDQVFKLEATVTYALRDGKTGFFKTGVSFRDPDNLFRAKLAEEIISMDKFCQTFGGKNGTISEEEKKHLWVKKNAERFADFFNS